MCIEGDRKIDGKTGSVPSGLPNVSPCLACHAWSAGDSGKKEGRGIFFPVRAVNKQELTINATPICQRHECLNALTANPNISIPSNWKKGSIPNT